MGLGRYDRAVGGRRSSHFIENGEEPPKDFSSISQTDAGGSGESWESHRAVMGYSWEDPHAPPNPVL